MLLSDTNVQKFLADRVICAWESVGPVPQVTIDFGNGKTMKRTLGGNTVLQLLLPGGRSLDAYPGVFTPADFLAEVQPLLATLESMGGVSSALSRPETFISWHQARSSRYIRRRTGITESKRIVEGPVLYRLQPGSRATVPVTPPSSRVPATATPPPPADNIYRTAYEEAARQLVDVSKIPSDPAAMRERLVRDSDSTMRTPEELGKSVIETDSRRNVEVVRPIVHLYYGARERSLPEARLCRDDLYRDLLHIPLDDPYLGLANVILPGSPGPQSR